LSPSDHVRLSERARREVEHGRRIAEAAEDIWNWASPAGQVRARRRAEMFVQLGGLQAGVRALEVGCGTGLFTSLVAASGADITAVDISSDLLATARARPECAGVQFKVADVHAAGDVGGPYDVIYGSSVLHHLDMSAALPVLHDALRTGGQFVFTEPNMANPQVWLERHVPAIRRAAGASPDETAFYRTGLMRLLQRTGFDDVRIRPFDWLHPATPGHLIGLVAGLGRVLEVLPAIREISGSLVIFARRGE